MRIASSSQLKIQQASAPAPTIEVDLGSLPNDRSFPSVLSEAMAEQASQDNDVVATAYTYFGSSVNFGGITSSAFVLLAGKHAILDSICKVFERIPGARVRPSDYLLSSQCLPQEHIEEGTLWRRLDIDNWYADVEMIVGEEGESEAEWLEEDENTAVDLAVKGTRHAAPSSVSGRVRAARSDARVGSIIRTIESLFALPEGSVVLCGPDNRALRRDARIATLRRRWE